MENLKTAIASNDLQKLDSIQETIIDKNNELKWIIGKENQ